MSSKNTVKKNSNKGRSNKINNLVKEYIDFSQASSTRRAYASDLRHFLAHGGCIPSTPKRLANYLADSAISGHSVATLERRVIAIHSEHVNKNWPSPARAEIVQQVLQGIRRKLGSKQRQAKPLTKDDLFAALDAIQKGHMPVRVARDNALLLIGFASGMRRSELVGVCLEHLKFSTAGLEIELPLSKTDQEGYGRMVYIPRAKGDHCPVKALLHWLKIAGIKTGQVFRSVNRYDGVAKRGLTGQSVALIVKAAMMQIGVDANGVSGHSLRAGYCTAAAEQGLRSWQIREQTGHKSDATLSKYIRPVARRITPSVL